MVASEMIVAAAYLRLSRQIETTVAALDTTMAGAETMIWPRQRPTVAA
jgi:hypothetical protein